MTAKACQLKQALTSIAVKSASKYQRFSSSPGTIQIQASSVYMFAASGPFALTQILRSLRYPKELAFKKIISRLWQDPFLVDSLKQFVLTCEGAMVFMMQDAMASKHGQGCKAARRVIAYAGSSGESSHADAIHETRRHVGKRSRRHHPHSTHSFSSSVRALASLAWQSRFNIDHEQLVIGLLVDGWFGTHVPAV